MFRLGLIFSLCLSATAVHAAAPKFQRLYPNEATATSFLQNDWNRFTENYHPNYAIDDDPKTAWVEGVEGNGEEEALTVRFSPLASVRTLRLRIRNGYQKSGALLAANAAPRDLTITLKNAAGEAVFTTRASLAKKLGWQQVELVPPPHAQVASATLRIESVSPGTQFKDTCISDVQVWVDSDVPYNAAAENAKRDALAAWIRDRVAAAKYFAHLPRAYPFAATHFTAHEDLRDEEPSHLDPGTDKERPAPGFMQLNEQVVFRNYGPHWRKLFDPEETARIQHLMDVMKTDGQTLGTSWQRVAFTGRIRLPDGLDPHGSLAEVVNYLDRSNFGLFEAAGEQASSSSPAAGKSFAEGEVREWTTSNVRVVFGDVNEHGSRPNLENAPLTAKRSPPIRELFFWRSQVVEERAEYEDKRYFLVCFDDQQRPTEVISVSDGSGDWELTATRFSRDGSGRIARVAVKRASYFAAEYDDEVSSNTFSETTYTAAPAKS